MTTTFTPLHQRCPWEAKKLLRARESRCRTTARTSPVSPPQTTVTYRWRRLSEVSSTSSTWLPATASVGRGARGSCCDDRHHRRPREPVSPRDLGDRELRASFSIARTRRVVILPSIIGCVSVWRSPQLVHSKRRLSQTSVFLRPSTGRSLTLTRRVSCTLVVLNPHHGQHRAQIADHDLDALGKIGQQLDYAESGTGAGVAS